jgi:hypothetical protein
MEFLSGAAGDLVDMRENVPVLLAADYQKIAVQSGTTIIEGNSDDPFRKTRKTHRSWSDMQFLMRSSGDAAARSTNSPDRMQRTETRCPKISDIAR